MSSFNDEMTAQRLAHEEYQIELDNAVAPSNFIYAKLAECASSHFANDDINGAEAILGALAYSMQAVRQHINKTSVEERASRIFNDIQGS
jgi:hypothetical protein